MFKLMDKKIIAVLRKLFLLNWPYGFNLLAAYYHNISGGSRGDLVGFT